MYRVEVGALLLSSTLLFGTPPTSDLSGYTLLPPTKHYYLTLAHHLNDKAIFDTKTIKHALSERGESDLSHLLKALAYDEVGDQERVDGHLESIKDRRALLDTCPKVGLTLSDLLLRAGKYREVLSLLPKTKILRFSGEYRMQALYYRAMALYLDDQTIGIEMKAVKNQFAQAKKIYYHHNPRSLDVIR